jgi:hypothetical protein
VTDASIPIEDPELAAMEKKIIEKERSGIKTGYEDADRPKNKRGRPKKFKPS